MTKRIPFPTVCRLEDGKPILFWVNIQVHTGVRWLECWTEREGHSMANRDYMQSLPLAPEDVAENTRKTYQGHLDLREPGFQVIAAKRLSIVKRKHSTKH